MKHDLQKNAHERDSDACKCSGDIPCVTKQRLKPAFSAASLCLKREPLCKARVKGASCTYPACDTKTFLACTGGLGYISQGRMPPKKPCKTSPKGHNKYPSLSKDKSPCPRLQASAMRTISCKRPSG